MSRRHNAKEHAVCLDDVWKTLSPEPLLEKEDLDAFYRDINPERGGNAVRQMALSLRRAHKGSPYKAFLIGHAGVGKSTEITQLIQQVQTQYQALRLSATNELDPVNIKPFDILLLTMIRLVEETARPTKEGGAGSMPKQESLRYIQDWLATENATRTVAKTTSGSVGAGIGGKAASLLSLFGEIKGELRYAADRKTETVEYNIRRLSSLMELVNSLCDECNRLLIKKTGKEWLLIWEDFDKPGFLKGRVEELFLTHGNLFSHLRAHMILTIPIELAYSGRADRLPFPNRLVIPDIPVYQKDHTPHIKGREAIERILAARISSNLFAQNQMSRLIVASGGRLRDLFAMAGQAADNALLRNNGQDRPGLKIEEEDAKAAINAMRSQYETRLGDSPYDEEKIAYPDKVNLMRRIYDGDPQASIPNPCLYSLLRAGAIQEFNGERWLGVHPLVVDILVQQGAIERGNGERAGGTQRTSK